MSVQAYLRPAGGLSMPSRSFSQGRRPATSHATLTQTPHVYAGTLRVLAVLVQVYDAYGNSAVSSASLTVRASLAGASDVTLTSYAWRGGSTRRYEATVSSSWFSTASPSGSSASITTTLAGSDIQSASFTVYGTPAWFASRLSSAGIAVYPTADQSGTMPAETMRSGQIFYLQLYAHTGGEAMGAFNVYLAADDAVCRPVPTSGSFSAGFEGTINGQTDGTYAIERLVRTQSVSDPSKYWISYSRVGRSSSLTATHGHLGYVRMQMVGSGTCLLAASHIAAFSTPNLAWISGVQNNDPVTLYGGSLTLYTDSCVGVLGQLSTNAPVVNTAYLTSDTATVPVNVLTLAFSSPDSYSSSSATVDVGASQATGSVSHTVSGCGDSQTLSFGIVRPEAPTLQVDDSVLERLPSSCTGYQSTRLRATVGGVDMSRLLSFSTSDSSVLLIDTTSTPGHPRVVAVGPGTASVYVKSQSFAGVTLTVSASQLSLARMDAGVVTSVTWVNSGAPVSGSFEAVALHEFDSEVAVGWLYMRALLSDGQVHAVESGISAQVSSSCASSLALTETAGQPWQTSVVSGAMSGCCWIELQTCFGESAALVNLTLPPPTDLTVSCKNNKCDAAPVGNCASSYARSSFADNQPLATYVDLVSDVSFADGNTRPMQTDARVVWSVTPASCGSFSDSGFYKRLTIAAACRTSSITVDATVTIGGVSQPGSKALTIKWLSSVDVRLFYQDAATAYTSSQVKWRFAGNPNPSPDPPSCPELWHSLRVRTQGTLSSGETEWLSCTAYTVSGAALSGSGSTRTLSITAAGAISLAVAPTNDLDSLTDSASLTAIATPDDYSFSWDLSLACSTIKTPYLSTTHRTYPRLTYTSGYVDTVIDSDRPSLIGFSSSQEGTIAVTSAGFLQPVQNGAADLQAQFCDGSVTGPESVHANLRYSTPIDCMPARCLKAWPLYMRLLPLLLLMLLLLLADGPRF